MTRSFISIGFLAILANPVSSQNSFNYTVDLQPVTIAGLPGLHSYAYGQHDGKWLVIGGRKDGIHARQPFRAFPSSQNNTDLYVIDVNSQQFWSASVNSLSTGLKEQLQSTNMNFHQEEDTLYIIGGYGYSSSSGDHITYPYLTTVNIPGLITAIQNGTSVNPYFKQITNDIFAVTGGHLDKLKGLFYLVGGQRFDGRYNPMNHPTFTQSYTNQVQKFVINNNGSQLSISDYTSITDPVHLRRRDYNLVPQIFPNGDEGFTISSGVFQINADLPFLYPVDITESGYTPVTHFNQYLSNYHSAVAGLYDSARNEMHSVFFGGMSQYYYQNGSLVRDDQVPFVKTISRVTRNANGILKEYQLPLEMPGLKGAGAEFIYNQDLPQYASGIIKLNQVNENSFLIGHIYGGIVSPTLNPFNFNRAGVTSADNVIYAVRLIKSTSTGVQEIDGRNPFDIQVYPNPAHTEIKVSFKLDQSARVAYYITNSTGQLIRQGEINNPVTGENLITISLDNIQNQALMVTFVFNDKFYVTKKVIRN